MRLPFIRALFQKLLPDLRRVSPRKSDGSISLCVYVLELVFDSESPQIGSVPQHYAMHNHVPEVPESRPRYQEAEGAGAPYGPAPQGCVMYGSVFFSCSVLARASGPVA